MACGSTEHCVCARPLTFILQSEFELLVEELLESLDEEDCFSASAAFTALAFAFATGCVASGLAFVFCLAFSTALSC